MTLADIRQRLAGAAQWLTPYRALWLRERDDHAKTRAERDRALTEACGWRTHHSLVADQRRRALGVLVADLPAEAWDATDDAILGAWLTNGEWPA